jgi:hypothetical protein
MMRRIVACSILLMTFCYLANAQDDSTRYEWGLPVTNDDTAKSFPAQDFYPPQKLKSMVPALLPKRVLKALTKEQQYRGWETGELYYDENTGYYVIHIPRGNNIHVFGLDRRGKPVSISIYARENRRKDK